MLFDSNSFLIQRCDAVLTFKALDRNIYCREFFEENGERK